MPIMTANGREWTQMGAGNSPERGILAGKQEMGTKTVGEMAFILFSCCFLFSCLGCGIG